MERLKNLINVLIDEPTNENKKTLINETWLWLVNEYDRTNHDHVVLLTVIKNAIILADQNLD